ncbi:MAG: phenylalanine--tRNA ligase subunit beta [Bacteroidales bacterium]
MDLSYKWLSEYLDVKLTAEEISEILTSTGLEVGSVHKKEQIKGGLAGVVVGKVITCLKHPNADSLSVTTVDIGGDDLLDIVCGAPNVTKGQKVAVATVGCTLYPDGDDNGFKIKKSKIRGEVSEGMLCAEDELGIGKSHDGILILDDKANVGTPLYDYMNFEDDYVIEVDITPNRVDGASYIGVARDIVASLKSKGEKINLLYPNVDNFAIDDESVIIDIEVKDTDTCPIYTGLTVSNLKVAPSPDWLQNKLRTMGLSPINNVVDITNYVLFETGQPLHAFDTNKIDGNKIVVKTGMGGTIFTTLDGVERKLDNADLMICSSTKPMCIGGVFGGSDSGVSDTTTSIFLECAYFSPASIRKTAKRHGLSTDASFRFERGVDPNGLEFALKRAAILLQDVCGGKVSSPIKSVANKKFAHHKVECTVDNVNRLIGEKLTLEQITTILESLEIKVATKDNNAFVATVPTYRVDVTREVDIVEEILRIYGYDTVKIPSSVKSALQYFSGRDNYSIKEGVSDYLSSLGYNEMWSNSLTKSSYYDDLKDYPASRLTTLENPLSTDLNAMRQSLFFGGMEAIRLNQNRKNPDLRLYEFGNCYYKNKTENDGEDPLTKYSEKDFLAMFVTGAKEELSWSMPKTPSSFYTLKGQIDNVLTRANFDIDKLEINVIETDFSNEALEYSFDKQRIAIIGKVKLKFKDLFSIDNDIYYAELACQNILEKIYTRNIMFQELPKYPSVRRDLSLLLPKEVKYSELVREAMDTEKNILTKVGLFDVYEGKNLPGGTKSYALSFTLLDKKKTLNDKQIDKTMQRIQKAFEQKFACRLR